MDYFPIGIILLSGYKLASLGYLYYHRRKKTLVGVVSGINIYPAKALGGVRVNEAQCTLLGVQYQNMRDR